MQVLRIRYALIPIIQTASNLVSESVAALVFLTVVNSDSSFALITGGFAARKVKSCLLQRTITGQSDSNLKERTEYRYSATSFTCSLNVIESIWTQKS